MREKLCKIRPEIASERSVVRGGLLGKREDRLREDRLERGSRFNRGNETSHECSVRCRYMVQRFNGGCRWFLLSRQSQAAIPERASSLRSGQLRRQHRRQSRCDESSAAFP